MMPSFFSHFLFVFSFGAAAASTSSASDYYQWASGPWADCQVAKGGCSSMQNSAKNTPAYGYKKRSVWCSNEAGHVVEAKLCEADLQPPSISVCFTPCPKVRCNGENGLWSAWSPAICPSCVGRQRRHLACGGLTNQLIEEQRACFAPSLCLHHTSAEAISQPSSSLRPPEALAASFVPYLHVGAWSECQRTLQLGAASEPEKRGKRRKQHKKKRSSHFEPPPPTEGAWPPKLPSDLEISFVAKSLPAPEQGEERREVLCRGQDGEELPFRVCVDGQSQTVVPSEVRSCVISKRCEVSSWSEWSLDTDSECDDTTRMARMVRHRRIEQPPVGQAGPCPHLTEYKPSFLANSTTSSSNCKPKFVLAASGWSQCRVEDLSGNMAICGGGLQDRNISCLRSQTRQPVALTFCSHLPQLPRVQRCFVACTDTCRVGPWSSWSACVPKDCTASEAAAFLPQLPGKQTRRRTPTTTSSSQTSSSSCPHLEEARDCSISSCYSWRLEKQEDCFLPRGHKCGKGTRKLLFACVDFDGHLAPVEACARLPKPPFEEECHIRCPAECVLTTWTEWSNCPPACHSQAVNRRLPLSYRNRTLLALGQDPVGMKGEGCHDLSDVRVCKLQTDCDTYHWRSGIWSGCLVNNSNCGLGLRRREAVCVVDNSALDIWGRIVPDWRCHGLQPPIKEEPCEKPCPKDCQLTQWSEWTSCSDGDQCAGPSPTRVTTVAASTVIMNTQSRFRRVLQWPSHGGQDCSRLMDVRPCPLQQQTWTTSCQPRFWRPQPWSQCQLPEGKSCGEGIRMRSLDCISSGGAKVDMKECLEDEELMMRHKVPNQHERCYLDCVSQCVTGPWSEWSSCGLDCPSRRSRSRSTSNKVQCEQISSVETEICPCQKYRSVPSGTWSDCLIMADGEQLAATSSEPREDIIASPFCGIGKRYRRLDCLDMSNQLAEPTMCGNQTYETDSCVVTCPNDCLMSPWSEWGLCDTICGFGLKNRTSKVLRLASVGGRPCPGPSVQYATCNYPCENFYWKTSSWSECSVVQQGGKNSCGKGRKTRTIRCVEISNDGLEMDVPSHYCDSEERPQDERDCRVYCEGQCVLAEWTEWSSCESQDCLERGQQVRNRTLLRTSSKAEERCEDDEGHLGESRPCIEACYSRYQWALTAWSSCQPLGDSSCGEGKRQRGLRCIRLGDRRPVRESLCQGKQRPPNSDLESWCPTDCPVDCEVSAWSPWDTSGCGCGRAASNMTRSRVVTTEASPTGRPCPPVLHEARPCPARPCYELSLSSWTCDLQGAACGVGHAGRKATCVRSGSEAPEAADRCRGGRGWLAPEDRCFKACPSDCVLSEWTSWSECRGQCVGTRTTGTRRRSRSIKREAVKPHGQCLSDLEENQTCILEPCHTYTPVSSLQGGGRCVRQDGLFVEDRFCRDNYSHSGFLADQRCDPPCRVLNSECGPDLKCRCFRGYHPTYLPAPILSSRPPTLVYCQILSEKTGILLGTNAAMANNGTMILPGGVVDAHAPENGTVVPMSYFPDDSQLNPWMLAMIGIGCVFIAFVGVSIYLMCKSTNQEVARVPKD